MSRQYVDGAQHPEREDVIREDVVREPVVADPTVADATLVAAPVVEQVRVAPAHAVPVVDTVRAVPAATVVQRRFWHLDPASAITAMVGIAMLLVGLLVITKAGFDGPLNQPVVEVMGFFHTPVLGLIETAAGVLLLLAGITRARERSIFLGVLLAIGGFVAAIQAESFQRQLAIEEPFAWLVVAASLVVVVANLLLPEVWSRSVVYETER